MQKVMIALSGGVDSSVAAFLMQKAGFDCIGATMRLCDPLPDDPTDAAADAQAVAHRLQMPFFLLDHRAAFTAHVIEHFICSYEQGLTPNPCVSCNRCIKFDVLLNEALSMGCNYIATGHYAQIRQADGRYLLFKAADKTKDQSYFLACLSQHQLAHTRFPLGEMTKKQVRQLAQEQGFITAKKRDSQDICFIPDGDHRAFIQRYTGKEYPHGNFLDLDGNVVGKHNGAVSYTIGQRKGLGLALGEPVYVCSKDMAQNTVTVGPDAALFQQEFWADSWNWIAFPSLVSPIRIKARIRYRHTEQPATAYPEDNGKVRIVFDTPQRAITPGQTVVLYDGDMVVGGGRII